MPDRRIHPRLDLPLKMDYRRQGEEVWQGAMLVNLSTSGGAILTEEAIESSSTPLEVRFTLPEEKGHPARQVELEAEAVRSIAVSDEHSAARFNSGLRFLHEGNESFRTLQAFVFRRIIQAAPRSASYDALEKQRVRVDRPILMRLEGEVEFESATVVNLSLLGMFIRTEKPAPTGTEISYELQLADGLPVSHGRAKVMWVREAQGEGSEPAGMGVGFVELLPADRRFIERIVQKHLADRGKILEMLDSEPHEELFEPSSGEALEARLRETLSAHEETTDRLAALEDSRRELEEEAVRRGQVAEERGRELEQAQLQLARSSEAAAEATAAIENASEIAEAAAAAEILDLRARLADSEAARSDVLRRLRDMHEAGGARPRQAPAGASTGSGSPRATHPGQGRSNSWRHGAVVAAALGGIAIGLLCGWLLFGQVAGPDPAAGAAPAATESTLAPSDGSAVKPTPGQEPVREEGEAPPTDEEAATPPEASSFPPSRPSPELVVFAWAEAWSRRDVEEYLDSYSSDYETPNGIARDAWEGLRRQRLTRPAWIRVGVEGLSVEEIAPDRVRVVFDQSYERPSFRDQTRKALVLVWEDEQWRIQSEESLP